MAQEKGWRRWTHTLPLFWFSVLWVGRNIIIANKTTKLRGKCPRGWIASASIKGCRYHIWQRQFMPGLDGRTDSDIELIKGFMVGKGETLGFVLGIISEFLISTPSIPHWSPLLSGGWEKAGKNLCGRYFDLKFLNVIAVKSYILLTGARGSLFTVLSSSSALNSAFI